MPSHMNHHILGRGVYTLAEVAQYTGLPPSTVRAWFKGRSDQRGRGPVFLADYQPVDDDFAVSFQDLIDANVAGQLRQSGVSMSTVRRAYETLRRHLDTQHPFAHNDIYTDGKRIFTYASETLHDERLIEALTQQHFFPRIKDLLAHIEYDDLTRLARRWKIAAGVVIDPAVSFGKPVVAGTGVTTFVLSRAFNANHDDIALVADLYNVSEDDVLNAVRFEEEHGWARAA